ncbi:hypothetical protein [Glutamicibacter sp. NPDC087344]|uniref:hypothetical protein n=1 Tax=Glutamicibacter sp. NPDC087344 TaxID=3363994 RepID=UPI00381B2B68
MTQKTGSMRTEEFIQAAKHTHEWGIESSHSTSAGQVEYLRCLVCASRRVELKTTAEQAVLQSRAMGGWN